MQSQNRFLDDLARLAAGAAGAFSEVRGELETRFREQFERFFAGMNLVDRDEFEAVKAMAAKARAEQEELAARLAALEARLAAGGDEAAASPPPRTTPRREAPVAFRESPPICPSGRAKPRPSRPRRAR